MFVCLVVYPSVRGGRVGAVNTRCEVQRAPHHVSTGGNRSSVLQPHPSDTHTGEHPLPTQPRANHSAVHQPMDERHRVLLRVRLSLVQKVTCTLLMEMVYIKHIYLYLSDMAAVPDMDVHC